MITLDRISKAVVLAWTLVAVAAEAWFVPGWNGLWAASVAAFLVSAALALLDRRAVVLVLVFVYLFPAAIRLLHGSYTVYYGTVWTAALVGAMAPQGFRTGWNIPARWRPALVGWALIIAIGTTLVVLREMDFYPGILEEPRVANSSIGSGGPILVGVWVIHVGLTLLLGILWFDWLFDASERLLTWMASAMGASALVMAAVAAYQMFVDLSFLNETVYAVRGRASGTVFDANVCGTILAMWIGGGVLLAERYGRWRYPAAALGIGVGWLGVWATSSRTAFLAATIVSATCLVWIYQNERSRRQPVSRRALAGAALAAALLAVLATADLAVVGPLGRVWRTLPSPSVDSIGRFAAEMWNRNGYGVVATDMIKEFPWFGLGVGNFHVQIADFPSGRGLPPDNAQNWYRHQVVEFGLIGSLGWIAWTVAFALFVLVPGRASAVAWPARGALIGFAVISLLGVPAQELPVAITFWTMAFWFTRIAAPPREAGPAGRAPSRRVWAVAAVVVLVYAVGTAGFAAGRLRVPVRAQHSGWPFSYGLYYPEPDGRGGETRWTRQRAAVVLDAPAPFMHLTVGVNHADVGSRPVRAKVWRDGELIFDRELTNIEWHTISVPVPDNEPRVLVETWVSRVVRPRELGVADDRELGLRVGWIFDDRPGTAAGDGDDRPDR